MQRFLLAAALAVAPAAAFGQQAARDNIDALIEQQAKANGVPASFVHAVVKRESNYNPNAKGGSALGLMQIKHATARSLGYTGDAAGLYDPATNLRYGVAYLAGAYRTAQGNLARAYGYYNRGYYYAAKRQGVSTEVAAVVAPVAASASALASLFGGGPAASDPGAVALAYAPAAAAVAPLPSGPVEVPLPPRRPAALGGAIDVATAEAGSGPAPAAPAVQVASVQIAAVEVPLPPRRPAGLGGDGQGAAQATTQGSVQVAAAAPAPLADLRLSPQTPASAAAAMTPAAATPAEAVAVPLPPRRPSVQRLAAAAPRRPAPAADAVREAAALPVE